MDPRARIQASDQDVQSLLLPFITHLKTLSEEQFKFLILIAHGKERSEGRLFYQLEYPDSTGETVISDPKNIQKLRDQIINLIDLKPIMNAVLWELNAKYMKEVSAQIASTDIAKELTLLIAKEFERFWDGFQTVQLLAFSDADVKPLKKFILDAIVFHMNGDVTREVQLLINTQAKEKAAATEKLFPAPKKEEPELKQSSKSPQSSDSSGASAKKGSGFFGNEERKSVSGKVKDKEKGKERDKKDKKKNIFKK